MKTSDLQLLRACAGNSDNDAFAQLVARHTNWLFAAARRRLEDDFLADDATQAVFMMLAGKASQLVESERESISAWLFHVMHLACGRLRRTRRRQNRLETGAGRLRQEDRDSRTLPGGQLLMLMEDAIWLLPPADREAIVLRFYQGENFARIGDSFNLSAEAVRKRISRALATVRTSMLRDGIDAIPDELLGALQSGEPIGQRRAQSIDDNNRINSIAKGTMTMMTQMEAIDFAAMSAEFFVKDVEANLDFFEKLGFRRHYMEAPDAMGRMPRASLRGGTSARIWLRRAADAEGTRPSPGVSLFFWINGGADALTAHRNAIAAQGVEVSPFTDDISLRNFTVTTPDGYSIGFFTAYK